MHVNDNNTIPATKGILLSRKTVLEDEKEHTHSLNCIIWEYKDRMHWNKDDSMNDIYIININSVAPVYHFYVFSSFYINSAFL